MIIFTQIFTYKFFSRKLYQLTAQAKFMTMLTLFAVGMLSQMVLPSQTAQAGEVAVSNYPLYLLSQEVTKGQFDAKILLRPGDVGHHGSLSPAALKQVKSSQFVVWFGRQLEQNVAQTLENSPNAIALFSFNSLHKMPLRDIDGKPLPDSFDPHIWLDPSNAKAIVAALTVIHSHAHPNKKDVFAANAADFYKKMDAATARYAKATSAPYWAYHDAFYYVEKALNLSFAGALTPDHHLSPKASRFKILKESRPRPVMCLASQLPVSDGIKKHLTPIKTLVRQEDMSDSTDFIGAWQDLADDFMGCVS